MGGLAVPSDARSGITMIEPVPNGVAVHRHELKFPGSQYIVVL